MTNKSNADTVIDIQASALERKILSNLLFVDEYRARVLSHLKPKYFDHLPAQFVFTLIASYTERYNKSPSVEELLLDVEGHHGIPEKEYANVKAIINALVKTDTDTQWLVDRTEKYCREQALHHALIDGLSLRDDFISQNIINPEIQQQLLDIPRKFADALAVSFTSKGYLMSLEEIVSSHTPTEYLIERSFKKSYVYSLTGDTGAGKTCIALHLAQCVAMNQSIGDRQVNGGRVVYLAGENPDDVKDRLIGMIEANSNLNNITLVPHASRENAEIAIAELCRQNVDVALVIVDTSSAYFAGDDENNNTQALAHAKWLRSISQRLPGHPTILVCCHPIKNAADDSLKPRGGGSFVNEMDGNLSCVIKGKLTIIAQHGKYRDVDFPPIPFQRYVTYPERLATPSGLKVACVHASYASEEEYAAETSVVNADDNVVLKVLVSDPAMSLTDIATKLVWYLPSGDPNKQRVYRTIKRLRGSRLINSNNNELTDAGRESLNGGGNDEPLPKTSDWFGDAESNKEWSGYGVYKKDDNDALKEKVLQ